MKSRMRSLGYWIITGAWIVISTIAALFVLEPEATLRQYLFVGAGFAPLLRTGAIAARSIGEHFGPANTVEQWMADYFGV
ncbi:MAG: hypothetical protein ABI411_18695 [Tahibacter sp.]